jgi:hypothetical protein
VEKPDIELAKHQGRKLWKNGSAMQASVWLT